MKLDEEYDIAIIGGGIAASLFFLSLQKHTTELKVLIIEQSESFPQKVGESVIDWNSIYFKYLGIQNILKKHPSKTGIRFLFNEHKDSRNKTFEFSSPTQKGHTEAYHINRKLLDQDLLDKCQELGAQLLRPALIVEFDYQPQKKSKLSIKKDGELFSLYAKWVVDASGRNRFIHNKLNWKDLLPKTNKYAVFAHFKDIQSNDLWDLPTDSYWQEKGIGNRDYATIQLCRDHHWWWIIRVDSEMTSIGLVVDNDYSSIENPKSFFLQQLKQDVLIKNVVKEATHSEPITLENIEYVSEKLHQPGVALIGDSGAFIDPLLASGLELIGQQSLWLSQLISSDLLHQKYSSNQWKNYETMFQGAYASRSLIYRLSYPIMESFDLYSTFLRFGNVAYFSFVVFPSILSKSRMKYPLRLNTMEKMAIRILARRLESIHLKRKTEGRFSPFPNNFRKYTHIRAPKNGKILLVPIQFVVLAVIDYLRIEWRELTLRIK